MPTQPNYLSPWNASGSWTSSVTPSGYMPNMSDPQYNLNYSTAPAPGSSGDPRYQQQLADERWMEERNKILLGAGSGNFVHGELGLQGAQAGVMNAMRMQGRYNPYGGGGAGGVSGGGGGGSSSADQQRALDRRFQMDLEKMRLAQLEQQNQWSAKMQGFGSDLSLRNNLYGIAAQQPTANQVGNALQIIGGDSARAFAPPSNPIGPANPAMDYFPGGGGGATTSPVQPPKYITRRG